MRAWEPPAIAVLLAIVAATVGPAPAAVALVAIAAVTPALCAVDVIEHRLPDRIVLPCYLACAASLIGSGVGHGAIPVTALVSGVATGGFMMLLGITGGMGMGDVKLGGVLGLAAGSIGLTTAMIAPLVAFLLGGAAAVVALRRGHRTRIPFGPFLLGGFWVAVIVS